jgi:hypothetical protein
MTTKRQEQSKYNSRSPSGMTTGETKAKAKAKVKAKGKGKGEVTAGRVRGMRIFGRFGG